MSLVVRGGTVVTRQSVRAADVVVDERGRIAAVTPPGTGTGTDSMDAGGLLVLPGMVDAHVHFDEPGRNEWEGFDTGSAAAVAGGVTTIVDMPIDCDPPTVSAADVRAKVAAARASSRADFALWGGLVPGSIAALRDMAAAGVAGFKAFACPSGWEEFPPVDEPALRRGAEIAAALQLPVAVHCELSELGHTIDSEVAAVRFAAGTVTGAGARLHVVHVSSAAGVDEARRWPGVSVETCAHYLAVDPCLGPVAHCSPPIRDADEREQLWSRVIDGSVDTIASDHSPCPPPMKAGRSPWAGIDGVGLAVPILLSSGRLELTAIASLITTAARLLRLPHKGAISVGYDADLALVDPAARWTVGPETLWSRHRLSPYEGMALMGQVVTTLVRGRVTFSKEEGPSAAGGGELIRPL